MNEWLLNFHAPISISDTFLINFLNLGAKAWEDRERKKILATQACSKSDVGALRALLSNGHGINDVLYPNDNLLLRAFSEKSNNEFISYLIQSGAQFPHATMKYPYAIMDVLPIDVVGVARILVCHKAMGGFLTLQAEEFLQEAFQRFPDIDLSFVSEVFGISIDALTAEFR